MADREGFVLEILKQYQKKSGILTELYRMTQEMEQMLAANDQGSMQLILEMRQTEMEKAKSCNETIAYLEEQMGDDDRLRYRLVLNDPHIGQGEATWEEKKIVELSRNTEELLHKIIELDKRINLKVAGKDSFYSQKK